MNQLQEIVHQIEKNFGRRLTDEEYEIVAEHIRVEARKASISQGIGELYAWVRTLPEDVKANIINKQE